MCLACSLKEDAFIPQTNDGVLQFNAAVEDYSVHNVSTKASDADINELTMLIFTGDGEIVGRPVNIPGSNPTFLVDTKEQYIWDPNATGDDQMIPITNGDENLHECHIYMIANSWETTLKDKYTNIKTLDDLMAITVPVTGIGAPTSGFPMIGRQAEDITFDLAKEKSNGVSGSNTLTTITMKKLYAMINVRFQVISDQVVETPMFTLNDWQVFNIPEVVSFGEPEEGNASNVTSYIAKSNLSRVLTAGDRNVEHTIAGSDFLEFSFYMPEHYLYALNNGEKVNKDNWGKYPANITDDAYQKYKPLLCNSSQQPTFVRVRGSYKDHNGNAKEVTYDIYLGQNPIDDFCIKRNQQLNNIITIKGTTDSRPDEYDPSDDNISVDHRVEIKSEGFVISLERETLIDSHFEVRPMDFVLSTGSRIIVTIDEESNSDPSNVWMRFEESRNTKDHISGVGVRKFFTEDLISTVLNEPTNRTLELTEDTRLWLYFDENPNAYDSFLDSDEENPLPKWRNIKLKVDYYAPNNNTDIPSKTNIYNFRQWHLWRIRNKENTRYYDIEHEEEYLYNYASDDNYGKTTNGMQWGLYGVQLSNKHKSFDLSEDNNDWKNFVNNTLLPTYDFYLGKHDGFATESGGVVHNFAGQEFTSEIASNSKAGVKSLTMAEQASGAVEYCYNRNKRNPDGSIAKVEWYLPSADELEDIMIAGYSSFKEFQENYYWVSQPAYIRNIFYYEYTTGYLWWEEKTTSATPMYIDNTEYARATKVVNLGNDQYSYAKSGLKEEPDNFEPRTESGSTNLGCFYEMPRWKNGTYDIATKSTENPNSNPPKVIGSRSGDERYTDTKNGNKRYFVHLGHLDDLMQEGYQLRNTPNRIRCAYKKSTN